MTETMLPLFETSLSSRPRVLELFAGVGGFHLAMERVGFDVVWANQYEPATKAQHAIDCLRQNMLLGRLPTHELVAMPIQDVLDEVERGERTIPDADVVVGGFPCQDYSVARTLSQAAGIQGVKGVLWWEIHRLLAQKRPRFLFLENVDRLLKSPAHQRGRDFAIMLASLADLGYAVEWRVVNAADYGFPQRRRRVFIIGRRDTEPVEGPLGTIFESGVLARALPVAAGEPHPPGIPPDFVLDGSLADLTETFGRGRVRSSFLNAGVMSMRGVWTRRVEPAYDHLDESQPDLRTIAEHRETCAERHWLIDVLERDDQISSEYFVDRDELATWLREKNGKRLERTHESGFEYHYSEGGIPFPDPVNRAARTILTGEGGRTPSRFKHIVFSPGGRWRRLTPLELERLNGFPDGWTATGMPDGRRAFMMGNALVVGLVQRVAESLLEDIGASTNVRAAVAVG
jgi:DNA (cytosine-5)-methyltransferase 1